MGQTIKILNQIVDTLKLQFYPSFELTLEELQNYNNIVNNFIADKKKAMEVKGHNNQDRFIVKDFNSYQFRVMATSQNSFNVILQNGDISIGLLKYSEKSNNPLIKVEFRSEFLLRVGYKEAINKVKRLINNFFDKYHVKVSELHLATDIQGYEFCEFDKHKIQTSLRKKEEFEKESSTHMNGKKYTGFTLGKGDKMLRIYNKTFEIATNKKKGFISVLAWENNPDFDEFQTVWRIEFQVRRALLKTLHSESGLMDNLDNLINGLPDIWKLCLTSFRHLAIDNIHIFHQMQGYKVLKNGEIRIQNAETIRKRFQRAELSEVWEAIQNFNDYKGHDLSKFDEIKKPEVAYVENSFKALISTYVKLNRGEFNAENLTKILLECDKREVATKGISLIDKGRLRALDYMTKARMYYERYGVINDTFHDYEKDLKENLFQTFALIENDNSSLLTFEEFTKRLNQ